MIKPEHTTTDTHIVDTDTEALAAAKTATGPKEAAELASTSCVRRIPLAQVRCDISLMMRAKLDPGAVKEYADHYRREVRGELGTNETRMPLSVIFEVAPEDYVLSHGWHRMEAKRAAGIDTWDFEVRQGSLGDAAEFAAKANRDANCVRYTNADKRNACERLFVVFGPDVSSQRVAALAGVDRKTAEKYRPATAGPQLRVGKDGKSYPEVRTPTSLPNSPEAREVPDVGDATPDRSHESTAARMDPEPSAVAVDRAPAAKDEPRRALGADPTTEEDGIEPASDSGRHVSNAGAMEDRDDGKRRRDPNPQTGPRRVGADERLIVTLLVAWRALRERWTEVPIQCATSALCELEGDGAAQQGVELMNRLERAAVVKSTAAARFDRAKADNRRRQLGQVRASAERLLEGTNPPTENEVKKLEERLIRLGGEPALHKARAGASDARPSARRSA